MLWTFLRSLKGPQSPKPQQLALAYPIPLATWPQAQHTWWLILTWNVAATKWLQAWHKWLLALAHTAVPTKGSRAWRSWQLAWVCSTASPKCLQAQHKQQPTTDHFVAPSPAEAAADLGLHKSPSQDSQEHPVASFGPHWTTTSSANDTPERQTRLAPETC